MPAAGPTDGLPPAAAGGAPAAVGTAEPYWIDPPQQLVVPEDPEAPTPAGGAVTYSSYSVDGATIAGVLAFPKLTAFAPENGPIPKGNFIVFQPSIFRCLGC